ncbi:Late embryogenesis abundant protein [compost metagenome]
MKFFILILAMMGGLTGCAGLNPFTEKPKVQLTDVFIKDTNIAGTTLVFVVNVANPNNKDIDVKEVSYTVFLSGKELTQAKTDKPIHVPANKDADVEIPLPIKYTSILGNLGDVLLAKEVSYRIQGSAKMSFFSIPFSKEGKVELR